MATSGSRLGLRDLVGAGARGVSRYTGTLFAVFVVQTLVAAASMATIALVLAQAFSHLPLFDDAVDGDLVAAIWCVRHAEPSVLAIGAVIASTVIAWQLATWFLVGGLYGVFAARPEGRGDTARCFGASGAATFLTYARLAVCSVPGWTLVVAVAAMCIGAARERVEYALTPGDLVGPVALAVVPAGLLLHYLWTVTDYARIELTLRHETRDLGELGVVATYLRAGGWVLRRPLTLVHGACGWIVFAAITVAYLGLSAGHPMYGAGGAVMLLALRLGISLLRMLVKVGVIAGQVELGRTRPLPARRIEPKKVDG